MKAIFPDGQDGIVVENVEERELFENAIRCRTVFSAISTGTERGIIQACRGKSQREIIESNCRLGYNAVGVVEDVRGEGMPFHRGQWVAVYGGPYVSHSERLVVPRHLAYGLPEGCNPQLAAYMGLGAIALHGLRQGRPTLGDVCVVAGAGIIGNLCAQLALLAGCRVVLVEPKEQRLAAFRECVQDHPNLVTCAPGQAAGALASLSHDRGADIVYLCMSTTSAEPIAQTLQWIRPGGRIVVVGVLDLQIPREPFFQKEAEITISRAAGPGRYDPSYERMGVDYPHPIRPMDGGAQLRGNS